MKKALVLFFICVSCGRQTNHDKSKSPPHAKPDPQTKELSRMIRPYYTEHFRGTIDNKIDIQMQLAFSGQTIDGRFRYAPHGSYIPLQGTYDSIFDSFAMDQKNSDRTKVSGRFEGIRQKKQLRGSWSSGDGKKSLPFLAASEGNDAQNYQFKVFYKTDSGGGTWLTQMTVMDLKGNELQKIRNFDSYSPAGTNLQVLMEDISDDGYPDIGVVADAGVSTTTYNYWIYDPLSRSFAIVPEAGLPEDVVVDSSRVVSVTSYISEKAYHINRYGFLDGQYLRIESIDDDGQGNRKLTKYQIKDGESIPIQQ